MSGHLERFWLPVTASVCLLVGMTGVAAAQNALPDAQVEASVLRALAGAPELANEAITTQTVYGTVTLSGSVHDESERRKAETLAANAAGVKKVVDELRLVSPYANESNANEASPSPAAVASDAKAAPLVLQSDGTYAPADGQTTGQATGQKPLPGSAPAESAQRNNPDADQQLDQQMEQQSPQAQNQAGQPDMSQGLPPMGQTPGGQAPGSGTQQANQQPNRPYAPYPYDRRPTYNPGYPGYPQYRYPQSSAPGYAQGAPGYTQGMPVAGGQVGGESVLIPSGAMIRVRINQPLSSNRSQPGSTFGGIVANDVVAGNLVAIPRGASVQGKVIGAKSSGVLKGRGEMQIQLTSMTLGGRMYTLVSDVWDHHGGDKTIETINKTAGFGAGGALIGALAGGGVGAAVGGGVGAVLGLGSSADSGNGQVYIPSEAMLTFHTARDATVTSVSEGEMQRLASGIPAGADQRQLRPRYPVYVAPGNPYYRYPGPYGPYGYPNY